MIKHLTTKIEDALAMTDEQIWRIFNTTAVNDFRSTLRILKEKGWIYIGSEGCEGFDPVTGCPGHPSETESITKQ